MRPAIEVWEDAYRAWDDAPIMPNRIWNADQSAAAVIEADRAALVAEIVADLRDMAAWNDQHDDGLSGLDKMATGQLEAADHIAAKFGGGSNE